MNDEAEKVVLAEEPADAMLPEVPRHLDRLEKAHERLIACVKRLQERCATVLSCSVENEFAEKPSLPILCTLACALRTYTLVTERACDTLDSLMERLEL